MISKGGLNGHGSKKDKLSGTPKRRKGERNAPATAKGMTVPRYFTRAGRRSVRRGRVGAAHRGHHRRGRQGRLRAEATSRSRRPGRRLATNVVVAEVLPRHARHAGARALGAAAHRPRRRHDHRLGHASSGYFADRRRRGQRSATSSSTCWSTRRWRSTRRSGSTSASRRSRSARPASSTRVDDTMESILGLAKTEGMLFKYGSGTGTNLSPIRSSRELLAGGGTASGPVSFMKGFDAFAGVIKSGGKTRRAAKMVILNADHPDIVEFINCKVERREEGLGAHRRRLRRLASTARRTSRSSSRTRTTRCASPTTSWTRCCDDRDVARRSAVRDGRGRWTPTRRAT